jgi:hypothetical protein
MMAPNRLHAAIVRTVLFDVFIVWMIKRVNRSDGVCRWQGRRPSHGRSAASITTYLRGVQLSTVNRPSLLRI